MSAHIIGHVNNIVKAKVLAVGEVAQGLGSTRDSIYLRTFDGFVDLNNPTKTWGPDLSTDVEKLPAGTKIELTAR